MSPRLLAVVAFCMAILPMLVAAAIADLTLVSGLVVLAAVVGAGGLSWLHFTGRLDAEEAWLATPPHAAVLGAACLLLACAAALLALRHRRRKLLSLDWAPTRSTTQFERRCARYLRHEGWYITYSQKLAGAVSFEAERDGVAANLVCRPNSGQIMPGFAERAQRERNLVVVVGDEPPPTLRAQFSLAGVKLIRHRDLARLHQVVQAPAAELEPAEAAPAGLPAGSAWAALGTASEPLP